MRYLFLFPFLCLCHSFAAAQNTVSVANLDSLDVSLSIASSEKAVSELEKQRVTGEVRALMTSQNLSFSMRDMVTKMFGLRPLKKFTLAEKSVPDLKTQKADAIIELTSLAKLLASADELSLRMMNGCGYVSGAIDQAATDKEMEKQTSVWRNTKVRGWFDAFKNWSGTVGSVMLGASSILASNGSVDRTVTTWTGAGGAALVLLTPLSQLFGVNEDSVTQVIKSIELSRTEYEDIYLRQSIINRYRERAHGLQNSLNWSDKHAKDLQSQLEDITKKIDPGTQDPLTAPLYPQKEIKELVDSLTVQLEEYGLVSQYIGESVGELLTTIDQYKKTYPEFKDRFVEVESLNNQLFENFNQIKKHHLKRMNEITDILNRWRMLVADQVTSVSFRGN